MHWRWRGFRGWEKGTDAFLRVRQKCVCPLFPFSLSRWRPGGLRLLVPAMAGVAGDVFLAVGEFSVDVLRQHDHLAGDVFFGVLVTGKIAFDGANLALPAGGEPIGLHGSPSSQRTETF